MKQIHYPHAATRQLEALEPLNAQPLHERAYEILTTGEDFRPDRAEEFADRTALLGKLMEISRAYTAEAGPFGDMFGEYLECIGETSQKTGRFFTPQDLVTLMADISIRDLPLDGRPKTICDPAAGTGRFMLGAARRIVEQNEGCLNALFVNIDIDRRMFTYCTMNAILHRIPAICIHGDTLKVEAWEAFATIPMGQWARWERVPLATAKDLIFAAKQGAQPVPTTGREVPVRVEG